MNDPLRLSDPDCPVEAWWDLAAKFPMEAQESVLYPLFTLESPERWHQLEQSYLSGWVDNALNSLDRFPFPQQCFLAADCGERFLPRLEAERPNEMRPRLAVEAWRKYGRQNLSPKEFALVREACASASEEYQWSGSKIGAHALSEDAIRNVLYFTARAQAWAACPAQQGWSIVHHEELRWQWDQIQQYLRGKR